MTAKCAARRIRHADVKVGAVRRKRSDERHDLERAFENLRILLVRKSDGGCSKAADASDYMSSAQISLAGKLCKLQAQIVAGLKPQSVASYCAAFSLAAQGP